MKQFFLLALVAVTCAPVGGMSEQRPADIVTLQVVNTCASRPRSELNLSLISTEDGCFKLSFQGPQNVRTVTHFPVNQYGHTQMDGERDFYFARALLTRFNTGGILNHGEVLYEGNVKARIYQDSGAAKVFLYVVQNAAGFTVKDVTIVD